MKITKPRLRRLIKEEVKRILSEGNYSSGDEAKASSMLSKAINLASETLKLDGKQTLSHVTYLEPHEVKYLENALMSDEVGLSKDDFDVDGGNPSGGYAATVSIYINNHSYAFAFDPDRGFYDI